MSVLLRLRKDHHVRDAKGSGHSEEIFQLVGFSLAQLAGGIGLHNGS